MLTKYLSASVIVFLWLLCGASKGEGLDTAKEPSASNILFRMHVLFLGDVDNARIGPGVQKDLNLIKEHYEAVARRLNYRFSFQAFTGNALTRPKVERHIQNLHITNSDIIVFVYSGHGFSRPGEKYSAMQLPQRERWPLDEAYQLLRSKRPHFCLVIGNCCSIPEGIRSNYDPGSFSTRKSSSIDFYKQLYRKSGWRSGIITASKVPDMAFMEPKKGSFFIRAYVEVMNARPYDVFDREMSWDGVLQQVKKRINELSDKANVGLKRTPYWKFSPN